MNRLILWLSILFSVAVLMSCGNKDDQETEATQSSDNVQSSELPPSHVEPLALGSLMDSLRMKKKKFDITRDQYWADRGGVLANEYFEVWYPPGKVTVTHGMLVFELFMPAREIVKKLVGEVPDDFLVVQCTGSLDSYKELTGREWWYYSEIKGDTIVFGPLEVLFRRGISDHAVPHEYFQWAVGKITRGTAPRWLEEGLASYLSNEGPLLLNQVREFQHGPHLAMTPEQIEEVLQGGEDREKSRIAYYRSHRMVQKLVETYGEDKVGEAIRLMGEGRTRDDAFMAAFEKDYEATLVVAVDYTVDLTRKKR